MGTDLSSAKTEIKGMKKAISKFSETDHLATHLRRLSESGEAGFPSPSRTESKDEDGCPLSLVAQSVNNVLKSSNRKIDEQIAATERAQSVAEMLREELDEKLVLYDTVIKELGTSRRLVKEAKSECNMLRESFVSLQEFKDQLDPHKIEISEAERKLGFLEEELDRYMFRGKLFDELCQEIKMMPFRLENADVAHVYFDALRDWVRAKEAVAAQKWEGLDGGRGVSSMEEVHDFIKGMTESAQGGNESFGPFESTETSFGWSPSVDDNGYEGAGEEEEEDITRVSVF